MKKLSIFLFLQVLMLSAQAGIVDDNYLHLADIEIEPGETKTVQLLMTNANTVAAVQGNIKLPDGLSFVTKTNGRLDVSNNNARAEDFTLSCSIQTDGSLTFAQYSGDGFNYDGNSGAIFTFKIKAAENATSGTFEIALSGVVLSIEGTGYDIPDRKSVLVVKGEDPVTITATSYTIEYGEALPTFGYTSEGAALQGTPALSCEATSTSPVGIYAIVVTQGTVTNGNVTYVNGTLTIKKAPLTIKGGTYTMKQGEELPAFAVTYEGFKNGETEDVLTTKPTLTTTATSSSAPGTYDVVVSGADAQNYQISYVNGTLTITASTGINSLTIDGTFDVYDMSGRKIYQNQTQLPQLPRGVYIVGGRKVVIK